jgi:hypothetical protein
MVASADLGLDVYGGAHVQATHLDVAEAFPISLRRTSP